MHFVSYYSSPKKVPWSSRKKVTFIWEWIWSLFTRRHIIGFLISQIWIYKYYPCLKSNLKWQNTIVIRMLFVTTILTKAQGQFRDLSRYQVYMEKKYHGFLDFLIRWMTSHHRRWSCKPLTSTSAFMFRWISVRFAFGKSNLRCS